MQLKDNVIHPPYLPPIEKACDQRLDVCVKVTTAVV